MSIWEGFLYLPEFNLNKVKLVKLETHLLILRNHAVSLA